MKVAKPVPWETTGPLLSPLNQATTMVCEHRIVIYDMISPVLSECFSFISYKNLSLSSCRITTMHTTLCKCSLVYNVRHRVCVKYVVVLIVRLDSYERWSIFIGISTCVLRSVIYHCLLCF